jgi:uncharacterized membrane protein
MTFEFYELQFLPLFLFIAFWFWQKKKFLLHILFLLLCLSIREEVSAIVFMFGLYSLIKKRGPKWVLFPIVLGLAWGLLSYKVIIPFFSSSGTYPYSKLVFLDLTKLSPKTLLSRENIIYLYWLLGPLLIILPFLSWEWILAMPIMLGCVYTSHSGAKFIGTHYQLAIAPVLFLSLCGSLSFLGSRLSKRVNPERVKLVFASTLFLLTVAFSGAYKLDDLLHFKGPTNSPRQVLEEAIKLIPSNASVLGPRYVNTHLVNRLYVYINMEQIPYSFRDYVLIDSNTNDRYTIEYLNDPFLGSINNSYLYKKIYDRQGVKLYKRQTLKD